MYQLGRPSDPGQAPFEALDRLSEAVALDRFEEAVAVVRQAISADPSGSLSHPLVKAWIARRYRYLFTVECAQSPEALGLAGLGLGVAPNSATRQQLAARFLAGIDPHEVAGEQPDPPDPQLVGSTVLFAPGLLTGLLPDLALGDVWPLMHARFGLRVIAADAHPMRGCQENVADLAAALTQGVGYDEAGHLRGPGEATPPEGDVLVVAYSKGGPDTLSLLAERPELAGRIRTVVGWAPAFFGSPVADEALALQLRDPRTLDRAQRALAAFGPVLTGGERDHFNRRIDEYDPTGAVRDLTRGERSQWWAAHRAAIAATGIPFLTVAADAGLADREAEDGPDGGSDLQLRVPDTRLDLPSFVALAVVRTDHWDIAYPLRNPGARGPHTSTRAFQPFPRAAAMAALIRTLAEVGLLAPRAEGRRAITEPAPRAAAAEPPVASAPPTRTDRVVADSARILAAWLYRSLEVHRVEQQPEGPVLALVNHGGGFEDPIVTIAASRRMPRFVARDVIWRVPGAAQVMRAVGAIPIHRRADSPNGGVDNHASFEAVTQALADGQLVAIFPEGESIDTPGVHRLRTGAARMALAAHTAGVRGVRIQPIGLHHLDKGALRSRAFVKVGPALHLDDLLAERGGVPADTMGQHALVRALTTLFTDALREVSPNFRDWSQARSLQAAAEIALRSAEDSRPTSGVLASYGNAARLADLLEDAPDDQVEAVTSALHDYRDDLDALDLTDADVAGRTALRGHLARRALQLAVAVPAAATTLPANAPGFVVACLVGRLPIAPPTMATVRPMAAMVAFPAGWTWYALRGGDRRPGRVLARYLGAQVGLASALVVADRAGALTRAGRASLASRRYPTAQVSAHRSAVLDAVTRAAEVAAPAAGASG